MSVPLRAANSARDGNLLQNPDFASGFAHWMLEGTMFGGAAKTQILDNIGILPDVPGKIARFQIWEISPQNRHLQFYQGGLDLQDGQPYTLTFWGRSDRKRPLTLQASVEDWHGIGLSVDNLFLTSEWRQYTQTFVATRTEKNRNRLTFLLGDELGSVELAGVELRRGGSVGVQAATVSLAGRAARPRPAGPEFLGIWESRTVGQASKLRFTFNGDGTGSVQTTTQVAPGGQLPRAPVSNPFRWYITEGKPALVIGSNTYQWAVRLDGPFQRLSLTDRAGKTRQLFRTPDLTGIWESASSANAPMYRFTFNGDGTGSVQTNGPQTVSDTLPRAPVLNPFRWYVAQGTGDLVIGSKTYQWTVRPFGAEQQLTLTDKQGKRRVLVRR